ncbi:MAG: WxcM-like domain-containing protein [Patescibacteria group bacterium]|jgi:dTDP-4-dehydrorhamnose 3,5-epimerase
MINGVIIKKLNKYNDERGWLCEIWRNDELKDYNPAMAYVSITKPRVTRGPHEHKEQSDCFIFIGPGEFELHLWDKQGAHEVIKAGESNPVLVVVPPGVVHGYKCVSDIDTLSINLPNELYKGENKQGEIDEIRWEDNPESPYIIK